MTKLSRRPPRLPSSAPKKLDSQPPRVIFAGRYRLEESIGKGGMGEVFAAYDQKLGRRVALKLVEMGNGTTDDVRARFRLEAVLSNQLRGPAFAEVYAHGTEGDLSYLAMELLDGETLESRLRRVGKLSIPDALDCLKGLGGALRLAHALQIVHRDLKPANIFFAKTKANTSGTRALDGRSEVIKLLDFGIAKDAWDDSRLTKPGVMLGSAHYMSPEQVRWGSEVDPRSDLWSLGVLLFRCLTGVRPFDGSTADALAAVVYDPPPRASSLNAALPSRIDRFFTRALEKDREKRFQTVDEVIDAFSSSLSTGAVEAAAGVEKRPASRISIDVDFDEVDRPAERPSVFDGDARPTCPDPLRRVNPRAELPRSGKATALGAARDSAAMEALLPIVMPVVPLPTLPEVPRRHDRAVTTVAVPTRGVPTRAVPARRGRAPNGELTRPKTSWATRFVLFIAAGLAVGLALALAARNVGLL